ncbi:MAG: type II toxin-antitoxin system RelE/ParE family toxin [Nitrospirae bacterium]|nr:MAG: type II toxin-antitoxin system RelE/ParE family toxin [Nitrospirota bacterium]
MSSYSVLLMPQARKDLDAHSGKMLSRLELTIMGLYDEPRPHNSKKLTGSGSKWRIRVGEYRILYEINEIQKSIKVYRIAHRKEVYR